MPEENRVIQDEATRIEAGTDQMTPIRSSTPRDSGDTTLGGIHTVCAEVYTPQAAHYLALLL